MNTIRLYNTVKKPKNIVQKALLERLSVQREFSTILIISSDETHDFYTAQLRATVQQQHLTDILLTINLYEVKDSRQHTHIKFFINYNDTKEYALERFILKRYIRYKLKYHFHLFTARVEKWL